MTLRLLGVLAAVLAFPGCGGGGDSSPPPFTATIESTALLTGTVRSSGEVATGASFVAGDRGTPTDPPVGLRAFLSFDLAAAGIPAGATVDSAVLTFVLGFSAGTPTELGDLLVDQVEYGNVLDAGAYDRAFPVNQGMGPIDLSSPTGTKALDVAAAVQECLTAPRPEAQFRMRFQSETDGDMEHDQVAGFLGTPPLLVVIYRQ